MVVCVGEEHVSGSECTICWAPLLYTLGVCVSVCKCEYIWLLQSRLRLVLFFCYIQRKINKYKTREYRTCNGKQKKKSSVAGEHLLSKWLIYVFTVQPHRTWCYFSAWRLSVSTYLFESVCESKVYLWSLCTNEWWRCFFLAPKYLCSGPQRILLVERRLIRLYK